MKNPLSAEDRTRCEVRLSELEQRDITNLTEFAERTLASRGLNPSAGEDVTQLALMAILQGLESDRSGRVPRPVDLENKDTFVNYVRGAVSSISEGMGRKQMFRAEHEPWEDDQASPEDRLTPTPAQTAEMTDLKDQLFLQLRQRAPRPLQRTIDAWESVFTQSDRIPAGGHRRNVGRVKNLAQTIISELGGIR